MAYQSVNPHNGKVLKTFKELTAQQLEKALKTAATCFDTWRCMTYAKRASTSNELRLYKQTKQS
jgi:succinate-semialdehyde dehydrogenase/glutarate-semialdehyde dehydrogenase